MSRLEAALKRASTGVVEEQAPVADLGIENPPDWALGDPESLLGPPKPVLEVTSDEEERREEDELAAQRDLIGDDGAPRFLKFSSKYSDKLVVSSEMPAA